MILYELVASNPSILLDQEDLINLGLKTAFINKDNGYVFIQMPGGTKTLHSVIAGNVKGKVIDHKNRNKLDNRRENLRHLTGTESQANTGTFKQYKGVQKVGHGRYRARIICEGRHHSLGTFSTAEKAAAAYNERAAQLFGEAANLNILP